MTAPGLSPEKLDAIQGPLDAAMFHAPYKVVNGAFAKKVVQANNHPSLRPYVLADNLAPIIAEFIATAPENMTALLAYARGLEARLGRVEELADYWERTPALRRGTSAASIRAALTATEGQA